MRARLHVVQSDDPDALVLDPEELVTDAAPPYPTADDTADELRDGGGSYSVERHRTYHAQRVAEWRESVPDYVVESVTLPAVGHELNISLLGP